MDILYYSNYCKHCQKLKQFFIKSNLTNKLNFICIDKRTKDPYTGQWIIVLETGQQVKLPPNVHSVPSLLVSSNYHVVCGDDIIEYFQPSAKKGSVSEGRSAVSGSVSLNGSATEPSGFDFGSNNISDQYTYYADGSSQSKTGFVDANHSVQPIKAEAETYRPNKLPPELTVDALHGVRNEHMQKLNNEDMNAYVQNMNQGRLLDVENIKTQYPMSPSPI
jgi:hypothetical protein